MKQFSITLIFASLSVAASAAPTTVKALRVNETHPTTTAYVLSTQEQLSGQSFQQDALVSYNGYQYTVYYNANRNVTIARRKLPLGTWKEVVFPHRNTRDDSHDVISMGICKNDGTIHLAYDHHNNTLQYNRSVPGLANDPEHLAWDISNFGAMTSQLVSDVTIPNVTYPRFINKPDGDLLFECRYKLSGDGDSYLREYNGLTHTWKLIGRYVQGMNANPNACAYINRMDYDVNGRLHVSWCWRDDFSGCSNHDLYYGYSDDNGKTWKDTHDSIVAVTELIDPTDSRVSGTCMREGLPSLKIATIPYNKGYINQETQATDSKGRVHIVNSYMEDGTDSNWTTSRTKAVLHHRYRDADGTWHCNLIKNNGANVNSYCRVQLIIDSNDNAIVIANGAEIYTATAANNYEDWQLLTNVDKDRFCSEPQFDHNAIKDGVLSFVYLSRNHTISVIDYLLDNPRTLTGTGLHADYYTDGIFTQSNGSAGQVLPGNPLPAGTKSVRWSGTLETRFAEPYTLYLTTTAPTTVSINDSTVLNTGKVSGLKTFSFKLPAINSHKNSLVIESKATPSDSLSLEWSGDRTAHTVIPAVHLYPDASVSIDHQQCRPCRLTYGKKGCQLKPIA
ncbi:MAG: BNR repeat-containing protein [Bacteroidota bacterium]|nr:BNR repeat-containing protein [Bacteroidota bacterium]